VETKDFVLAVIPPALAILLEAFTPFTARFFAGQANQIVGSEIGPVASETCKEQIEQLISTTKLLLAHSMAGASSLAGLAPTFVSFIVSGFAIFVVISNPYWWLLGFAIAFLVLAILIQRILSGRSLFELETTKVTALNRPPTCFISLLIYVTNIVLIAAALSIYLGYVT
jgi:hypothetical protein